jgi:hypothetical protein
MYSEIMRSLEGKKEQNQLLVISHRSILMYVLTPGGTMISAARNLQF